ncbi:hypothetical protein ACPUVO_18560 [Pseudocolwellia sp. HL-MZ19]|uniref:hypothetical protein n=1 Tax=Pseudocolwellia sp. HL-MZ19 TaxID=3400846 RepID=UPI003CE947B4
MIQLGDDYSLKAKLLEDDNLIDHKYNKNKVILSTILGLNAVKNGDGKSAELLFQSVAERRGVEWLPIVAHGTAMIVENPSVFVIKDITKLMTRDDVSLEARNKLAQLRAIANQNLNDPDKMKSSAGDVLQRWTLDSIKSTGTTAGEVMLDVVAKVVESILTLGHF